VRLSSHASMTLQILRTRGIECANRLMKSRRMAQTEAQRRKCGRRANAAPTVG